MFWSVVLFLGIIFAGEAARRPHYIIPCARSHDFNDCALKNGIHAMPYLLNGDKDLKIPNMNPLVIPLVDLRGANEFHLKITNMEVYGLDTVKLQSIRANFEQNQLDVESTADLVTILGDYEMSGRILMLPLTGNGRLNITLQGGDYIYGVKWVPEYRNGKEYTKIVDSSYDYKLKRMGFDFQNLFNGDKLLGEEMNRFLNENWQIVNDDLKKAIVETLLAVHTDIAVKIFSKIPTEELFLD